MNPSIRGFCLRVLKKDERTGKLHLFKKIFFKPFFFNKPGFVFFFFFAVVVVVFLKKLIN